MELRAAAGQIAGLCDSADPSVQIVLFMDANRSERLDGVMIRDPMVPGYCEALSAKILERDPEILALATRTSPRRRAPLVPLSRSWAVVIVTGAQGDAYLLKPADDRDWTKIKRRAAPMFMRMTASVLTRCIDGGPLSPFVRTHDRDLNGWYLPTAAR